MGMWDEICVACGGALSALDIEYDFDTEDFECIDAHSLEESTKWLDDRVGITDTEERVPLGRETGYGSFELDGQPKSLFCAATVVKHMTTAELDGVLYGLTCHSKCLELLERDLHYTLRFQDVWPMLMRQQHGTWLECTDYGGIAEFIDQGFCFQSLYRENKGWMLEDPTTNVQNGERIVKVWRDIIQRGFQANAEPDGSQARNESPPKIAIDSVDEHEADRLACKLANI